MKLSKRISIIDIGSNSIRLLIGDFEGSKINKLYSDRTVTRLGRDISINRKLNYESIDKSIEIINKFKVISEQYNANIIIPIGTSALREAEDSAIFCNLVKNITGLEIIIITGEEEAYYTLEGIKLGFSDYKDFIALDIGGGSTEWIFEEKDGNITKGSLKIGALKANQKFNLKLFQTYLNKLINENLPFKIKFRNIISTGGTSITLAMIDLKIDRYIPEIIHGHCISYKKLQQVIKEISETSINERRNIIGIPPDRFDIIIPGLIILDSLVKFFDAHSIIISDYGFLEGVMKNYRKFCYN